MRRRGTFLLLLLVLAPATWSEEDPWARMEAILQRGDPAERRAGLEELLTDEPDFHPASYNLGTMLLADDPDRAATLLRRASASADAALRARAFHNLAHARHRQGRLEAALAAAESALRHAPGDAAMEGTYRRTRDALRAGWLRHRDELRRQREAAARRLRLIDPLPPPGRVARDYRAELRAAGGDGGPYAFFAPDGGEPLPEDLALAEDGTLSGIPGEAGSFETDVGIRDGEGTEGTDPLPLRVLPPLEITTGRLQPVVAGLHYRAEIHAEGVWKPTWRIEGLPEGLHLVDPHAPTAVIEGTTARRGEHPLTVVLEDHLADTSAELVLAVGDDFSPAETRLEDATAWAPYEDRLTVRGPPGDYRWRSEGKAGITVDERGNVTGIPDREGLLQLPVTMLAGDGTARSGSVAIKVNPPPLIEEEDRLDLKVGEPVERSWKRSGGTPPYTWSVEEGALPEGLSLVGDHLVGAARAAGETTILLAVEDRWQASTSQEITLVTEEPEGQQEGQQQEGQEQEEGQQQQQEGQEQEEGQQQQEGQEQEKGQQQQEGQEQEKGQQQQEGQKQEGQEGQEQKGDEEQQEGQEQSEGREERGPRSLESDEVRRETGEGEVPGVVRSLEAADALEWLRNLEEEDEQALRRHLLEDGRPAAGESERPW